MSPTRRIRPKWPPATDRRTAADIAEQTDWPKLEREADTLTVTTVSFVAKDTSLLVVPSS
jgi:hypothetical protein